MKRRRVGGLFAVLATAGACSSTHAPPPVSEVQVKEPPSGAAGAGPTAAAPDEPRADLEVTAPQGCYPSCSGIADHRLQMALRKQAGEARGCFERELRRDPTLSGRVTVTLDISEFGKVCASQVTSQDIQNTALLHCIRELFLDQEFPAPTGGCVVVALPLNLVPKSPDAGAADAGAVDGSAAP